MPGANKTTRSSFCLAVLKSYKPISKQKTAATIFAQETLIPPNIINAEPHWAVVWGILRDSNNILIENDFVAVPDADA